MDVTIPAASQANSAAFYSVSLRKPTGVYATIMKPVFDMIFGFILFLVSLPFFAVIGLIIKLESKGPVLFRQQRVGRNGKTFYIYKLRTMYEHVPVEGLSPDSSEDPRITRVGRFIRATSLDEIPQLINVVKGDMSFVGPRPEQKSIVEERYTVIERQRLLVKPGMTGYWQISEHRRMPIHENLQHDFHYIAELSWRTDLIIILRTFKVLFISNTN